MTRELRRAAACRNCHAEVTGNFCAGCGQENTDYRVSLRRLVGDLVDEVFQLESRLWRSLWALFRHPGLLTREYNAGRRVRYTTPLRLYMLASIAYFLVAGLVPDKNLKMELGSSAELQHAQEQPGEASPFVRDLERRLSIAQHDPEAARRRMQRAVLDWGPRIMALLVPLFALLTFAFFRQPRHFYVEHLVFALHLHAAAFFLWMLAAGIRHYAGLPLFLAVLMWSFLAARNVFEQSWGRLSWKLPLLGMIYCVLVSVGVSAVVVWSIMDV
jgi:hypothetical protein